MSASSSPQMTAPTSAATAVSSTKEMYSYWCTAERSEKPLCKHHALIAKMTATTDPEQRKALATEVKSLYTQAKTMSAGGGPGSVNPFAKDYADMKIAYCATSPAGAKTLCSTAASRFSPSGSSGSVTSSTSQAMEWCACAAQRARDRHRTCPDAPPSAHAHLRAAAAHSAAARRRDSLLLLACSGSGACSELHTSVAEEDPLREHAPPADPRSPGWSLLCPLPRLAR